MNQYSLHIHVYYIMNQYSSHIHVYYIINAKTKVEDTTQDIIKKIFKKKQCERNKKCKFEYLTNSKQEQTKYWLMSNLLK